MKTAEGARAQADGEAAASEEDGRFGGRPCMLGIDEAGRGPVLGPMVYGVAWCPLEELGRVKSEGFNDSKQLTECARERMLGRIQGAARAFMGHDLWVGGAAELSGKMLRRDKYNLNAISHDVAIGLIRKRLEDGVNVQEIYVDTVGDPGQYQAKLERLFGDRVRGTIVVCKKADSIYPIVSAASIVAKVSRDTLLRDWVFEERELRDTANKDFGSGYPGDERCKAWLRAHADATFGFPSLVRFSWKTVDTLLDEMGARRVEWEADEDDEERELAHSGQKRNAFAVASIDDPSRERAHDEATSRASKRAAFFRTRALQRVRRM